ncbi:39S ribosomal protein L18-like protein [Leptotrombidium deliense]|uniref:39S ribosomal protein L18-like protein n=1 Tax=Leptotrombidium deliense TaxID=299467 RepID=A0A443SKY6_9ACAR|nr:39S ribosomal protein L18-like protein [Leptotrombidium deliense]
MMFLKSLATEVPQMLSSRFAIRFNSTRISTLLRNDNQLYVSVRCAGIYKKRITRLQSDIEFTESDVLDGRSSENDVPPVQLVNRNPRNLEQLQFEQKSLGFEMDSPSVTYWNKIVLQRSGQHLKASVLHHSGADLISCVTCMRNENSSDISSATNLGMILAKRCLEAGLMYVHIEMAPEELRTQKVDHFLKALRNNGLILKEPDFIFPRRKRDL